MSGFLSGVTGWGRDFVSAYIVPVGLTAIALIYVLAPLAGPNSSLADIDIADSGVDAVQVLAFVFVGAVLLDFLSSTIYEILFGSILVPSRVREWAVRRQIRLRDEAIRKDQADRSRREQRSAQYPYDDDLYPTVLANVIAGVQDRLIRECGIDIYGIGDELRASAPEALRSSLREKTSAIDFFINLCVLLPLLACISFANSVTVVGGFSMTAPWLLVVGVAALFTARLSYLGALVAASNWTDCMNAVVHLGRVGMAINWGLNVPAKISKEREMWNSLATFIDDPDNNEAASILDLFRVEGQSK